MEEGSGWMQRPGGQGSYRGQWEWLEQDTVLPTKGRKAGMLTLILHHLLWALPMIITFYFLMINFALNIILTDSSWTLYPLQFFFTRFFSPSRILADNFSPSPLFHLFCMMLSWIINRHMDSRKVHFEDNISYFSSFVKKNPKPKSTVLFSIKSKDCN